jgi:hypothetical protein
VVEIMYGQVDCLKKISAICVFFAMVAYPVVHAEMYKWVDKDGNVNYTQTPPPPGITSTTIKPPPTTTDPAAVERLQKQRETVNKLSDQRVKQAEQEQKTSQEKSDKSQMCEQARSQMAAYERPRVSVTEAGGQRVLGEEERLQGLEKARQRVTELCK